MIVGGGFGGLATARALLGAAVDVTLVDANNFHTFQPLLYQVATAGLDGDDVAYAIRGSVAGRRGRRSNVTVRMARVTDVDLAGNAVVLGGGDRVAYDVLVLATGAVSHDFGVPGVRDHTFPLKHVEDALALRAHVLSRFEEAVADPSLVGAGALDVVVCGGGATGVELAGGLRELYEKVLAATSTTCRSPPPASRSSSSATGCWRRSGRRRRRTRSGRCAAAASRSVSGAASPVSATGSSTSTTAACCGPARSCGRPA